MLREKSTDFEVQYIDLANKPEWFLEISPRGKVPVLVTDDDDVLFESGAICEYLEEAVPSPALFPNKLTERARDRAWFTFTSEELMSNTWGVESASTQEKLEASLEKLRKAYAILEDQLDGRDYLSGDGTRFGMADVGASSALFRAQKLKDKGVDVLAGFARCAAWRDRVLARETIPTSVPDSWQADWDAMLARLDAVVAR